MLYRSKFSPIRPNGMPGISATTCCVGRPPLARVTAATDRALWTQERARYWCRHHVGVERNDRPALAVRSISERRVRGLDGRTNPHLRPRSICGVHSPMRRRICPCAANTFWRGRSRVRSFNDDDQEKFTRETLHRLVLHEVGQHSD